MHSTYYAFSIDCLQTSPTNDTNTITTLSSLSKLRRGHSFFALTRNKTWRMRERERVSEWLIEDSKHNTKI